MIGFIWSIITGSRITRLLAKIAGIVLAVLTFGAWQRQQGAQGQKAKQAAQDAKKERDAHDRINKADTGASLDDDQRTQRLREFAAKHGTGQAKGKGG